jgi:hypothetical protein
MPLLRKFKKHPFPDTRRVPGKGCPEIMVMGRIFNQNQTFKTEIRSKPIAIPQVT